MEILKIELSKVEADKMVAEFVKKIRRQARADYSRMDRGAEFVHKLTDEVYLYAKVEFCTFYEGDDKSNKITDRSVICVVTANCNINGNWIEYCIEDESGCYIEETIKETFSIN